MAHVKNFGCVLCSLKFADGSGLRKHLKIHSREKCMLQKKYVLK